jgi:hypothetical protein
MSGYLHRLAAQALGRAVTIRPPPRRPWPARVFADPPAAAVEQRDDAAIAAIAPAIDRAPPLVAMRDTPVVPADVAQPVMKHPQQRLPAERNELEAPAPAVPDARPAPHPRNGAVALLSENVRSPAPDEIAAPAPPSQIADAAPRHALAEQQGRTQARAVMPTVARPAAAAAASVDTAAIRPVSSPLRERSRPPVDAARLPDVHIHIGRIELAAVAPPPPRRESAAAKPTSLDEYLQRSTRKRS